MPSFSIERPKRSALTHYTSAPTRKGYRHTERILIRTCFMWSIKKEKQYGIASMPPVWSGRRMVKLRHSAPDQTGEGGMRPGGAGTISRDIGSDQRRRRLKDPTTTNAPDASSSTLAAPPPTQYSQPVTRRAGLQELIQPCLTTARPESRPCRGRVLRRHHRHALDRGTLRSEQSRRGSGNSPRQGTPSPNTVHLTTFS